MKSVSGHNPTQFRQSLESFYVSSSVRDSRADNRSAAVLSVAIVAVLMFFLRIV